MTSKKQPLTQRLCLQVQPLPDSSSAVATAHLARLIQDHQLEDPIYLLDLGCAARLMAAWRAALPRVQPCYAVKCNDDPALLRLLACLGAGFDCASDQEVRLGLAATQQSMALARAA